MDPRSHGPHRKRKKADLAARKKAEKGGKQAERWSSLAHIKKNLAQVRSTELTKWHETKIEEREVSRRSFYIPWTKAEINSVLENAPKKYAARYYQLKVGHGAVGTYLAKIGKIETPQCWWCRELGKEGVTWQAQAERRWLAGLLANEKAVTPLLRFLKATEVGARGRVGTKKKTKQAKIC